MAFGIASRIYLRLLEVGMEAQLAWRQRREAPPVRPVPLALAARGYLEADLPKPPALLFFAYQAISIFPRRFVPRLCLD
jgi:hypothetical protein